MKAYETGHAEPGEYLASPIYRVNFWERPAPGFAFNLDAFVLVDASGVDEVLQWAASGARGRTYEVMVEAAEEPVEPGLQIRTAALLRLAGENPNEVTRQEPPRLSPPAASPTDSARHPVP
ncbi:hypothetical protein [Agromyces sp. Root81]|uniref:hypothetical protein n=1 Tax=Agromyces sp. Root81 TaxID=1736601 RepID=UPI001911149E|nr:hypothetical protein [Agromyces sp. Root81]